MKKRKLRERSSRLAPIFKSVLIGLVSYLVLLVVLLLGVTPEQHDIRVGVPAPMDILASKDVKDTVTTEQNREAAAAKVDFSYKSAEGDVTTQVIEELREHFSELEQILEGLTVERVLSMSDADFDYMNGSISMALTREQYAALLDTDAGLIRQLGEDTEKMVREQMNNTILEGQELTVISTISRSLAASGYSATLAGISTEIMRLCVRPNMLIDEAATEENRLKAREAVEDVVRVKGEVIVRRGEIVKEAQYEMLSSLGLLMEERFDIPLLAGIALILLLIHGSLLIYLLRYRRDLLMPKPLSLLCVIYLLEVVLSLAISNWSVYLMPISMGMLLITLLLDSRVALYFNFALGMTVSLLAGASNGLFTVAMFSVVVMSLVSGPVVLMAFGRAMQRTTTLLAGVLVGLSNFLVTLAVGLINSTELTSVITNALWATAGGLLCGVICIGLQPLLEWVFNLATNARLIELSNPNQPILRRLLLEAPGTYHHSIIVANLAEAAATAVGGNGLLARVGAYYHDIGKLKRPVYFKENQMGDNPHDRTDPRVSAAILTAHPRDGAAMGQKARLPRPVLDIIRQHHGDGVVLWFYDKAVKLYGAEQTDISAFRYEGPRPHSREAAVVMLADSIEAAVRSLPDPNPEKVDALIRKLVRVKLDDGQLDQSDLTFGDLEKICSAFSTVLTGVFHERIEYPDIAIPPRKQASEDKEAAPAGQEDNSAQSRGKPAGRHADGAASLSAPRILVNRAEERPKKGGEKKTLEELEKSLAAKVAAKAEDVKRATVPADKSAQPRRETEPAAHKPVARAGERPAEADRGVTPDEKPATAAHIAVPSEKSAEAVHTAASVEKTAEVKHAAAPAEKSLEAAHAPTTPGRRAEVKPANGTPARPVETGTPVPAPPVSPAANGNHIAAQKPETTNVQSVDVNAAPLPGEAMPVGTLPETDAASRREASGDEH